MEIFDSTADFEKIPGGCVLSIGNFDGVHIGHKKIFSVAVQIASEMSTMFVVLTFEPHPVAVLHPEKSPGVLTPLALKKKLLEELGIGGLVVLTDSRGLLRLSAADFVDKFLIKTINPSVVVEGDDFNFGARREGDIHTLRQLGQNRGFDVELVEAENIEMPDGRTQRASSTLIRNLLTDGKVGDAAVALGRYYRLVGRIVTGQGIGRQLGYPTLNMGSSGQIIPAEGVYAGFVKVGGTVEQVCSSGKALPAVFSIGRMQTFGDDRPLSIEAHILTEVLEATPNCWMAMDFVKFLREQQKFETKTELAAQIEVDCKAAKAVLAAQGR